MDQPKQSPSPVDQIQNKVEASRADRVASLEAEQLNNQEKIRQLLGAYNALERRMLTELTISQGVLRALMLTHNIVETRLDQEIMQRAVAGYDVRVDIKYPEGGRGVGVMPERVTVRLVEKEDDAAEPKNVVVEEGVDPNTPVEHGGGGRLRIVSDEEDVV